MGASTSVAQLDRILQVLLGAWDLCPVDGNITRSLYVDDSVFALQGTYDAALAHSLHILADMVMLGFSVNLKVGKSQIAPARIMTHLGFVIDSSSQRISLSNRKVNGLVQAVQELADVAAVGQKVSALSVASVVGKVWSIHAVAHRATAIEARAMIATLQKILGVDEVRQCKDPGQLRWILKRIWKGDVLWTADAERELQFWRATNFAQLEAALSFDAVHDDMKNFAAHSSGVLASDVQF